MTPQEQLAETVRLEGARVLATLIRTLGSLQLAEDAVQDAAVAALQTWPRDGIPDDPRAWLTVTARHKAYDALRREAARPGKELAATGGAALVAPDLAPEVPLRSCPPGRPLFVLDLEPQTGIKEDEMTALTTSPAPAAGAGSPRSQTGLPGSQADSPRRPRVTLVVGSLAGFMIGLDATVVTTALPTIHATLHASASALGWTVSAYSLAFAALILTGTALGDKFGRRRVFLAGFAVFTLASAACALAPGVAALIAARAVQGAGGGIATPLSLALITEAFPIKRRGAVVSAWGAITGVAVGFGPVIGGAIVQGIAWPWVFWVNVPIGIILVTLGRKLLAESRGPARRLDPAGLLLATGAVFAITDALLRGPQAGWHSAQVLALFGTGAALAAAFILTERRLAHPMIPPRLLANPMLRAAVATRFLLFATILGAAFLVPQYLQLAHGYSPLRTGLSLLPFTSPMMLIAPVAGKAADRPGERAPIVAGFTLAAAGFTLLGLTLTATASYPTIAGPLLLAGIGVGLAVPTTVSASLRAVTPQQAGLASGVGSTLQNIGGVFGVATATAIFAASGSYLTPEGFVHGLRPALLALAILAALGALAGRAVRHSAPTSR